ncbi:MAG: OmpA family protein [Cytophagales bacterium]|nr:OmpA family protein [Cytophagales bacterium]
MMITKTLLTILFFFLFQFFLPIIIATAQNQTSEFIKKADKLLEENLPDFNQAIELYLKAHKTAPKDHDLNFKIGLCYLNTHDKTAAVPYLEKVVNSSPASSDHVWGSGIHYLLARAYQLNFEFDKATSEYIKYNKSLSVEELIKKKVPRLIARVMKEERNFAFTKYVKVEKIKELISKKIKECKSAKLLVENPVDVIIENIGTNINTPYPEYGPVITADESVMYFTSRREGTTGGEKDYVDGKYFEDIYVSFNKEGTWSEAKSLGPPICTEYHESVIGLSADGQKLFIFKDENLDGGDLYVSRIHGSKWSAPESLPEGINSSYGDKSVTISADGKLLFFVSNRPGGKGGKDIYMCKKSRAGWATPKNLSSRINSKYDEDGVFFHPDGKTLYFSSRGHPGLGGYDIFEAKYENGRWSKPKNLGYPINTTDDDIYFVLSASGKKGYYASFRNEGEGEKDIYVINFEKPTKKLTLLTGIISDDSTHELLEANIQVIDNDSNKVIEELFSNAETGKYLITLPSGRNYGINVTKEDYLFHSENFDIAVEKDYQEIEKNITLKKIVVGIHIVLKNIFFDYDESTLRPSSLAEQERLYELLQKYPKMKIEVSGHTDNKGSEEYNKKLSEKRAQAVVDYLISKGIVKERLIAVGYGPTKPIAPNQNPDGSDNPDGRQLNRRTEFEILGN